MSGELAGTLMPRRAAPRGACSTGMPVAGCWLQAAVLMTCAGMLLGYSRSCSARLTDVSAAVLTNPLLGAARPARGDGDGGLPDHADRARFRRHGRRTARWRWWSG